MPATLNYVMTGKEVADYLRVNQHTAYRSAVDRKMSGFKVGVTWRFKRSVVDVWIATQSSVVAQLVLPSPVAQTMVR